MPKNTKRFIDKRNAVTFNLVHRSQQDPLIADETAPQHVLVATSDKKQRGRKDKDEEHKYGIYYDDDYDYLQHLRDASKNAVHWIPAGASGSYSYATGQKLEKSSDTENHEEEEVYRVEKPKQLRLPSSVFASEMEEDVGLLNKAAPQSGLRLDLDPDVVAAMDEDFDYDDLSNQLEDDFIQLANAEGDSNESFTSGSESGMSDTDGGSSMNNNSEMDDELGSLDGQHHMFEEEETKSRFTEYSMSSSVIRRNNQLSLLDHRFEKMFAAYDDNEIGALDCEDIEGFVPASSKLLVQCADEFEKRSATENALHGAERVKLSTLSISDSDEETREVEVNDSEEDEKWDCQSVLSTYSNIYNRPKLISEVKNKQGKIRISAKTGLPIGVFDSGNSKLTARTLAQLDHQNGVVSQNEGVVGRAESILSNLSTLSIRPKGETPEERRARKRALKEYRRERIVERKANTEAFKEEKKRQEKVLVNNKKNIPTLHIN